MTKAVTPQAESDELDPAEFERFQRWADRRAAEKIAALRRAAGLREATATLRVLADCKYPTNLCTASRSDLPADIRCSGAHPWVGPQTELSEDDLVLQWSGHLPTAGDTRFAEVDSDPDLPTVEALIVLAPPFVHDVDEAKRRLDGDDANDLNLDGQMEVLRSEKVRIQKLREQHQAELGAANQRLQNFLSEHTPKWVERVFARIGH